MRFDGCLLMSIFKPKCPVSTEEKRWIEAAMKWLCDTFDSHPIDKTTVILPTPEFFPDRYSTHKEDVKVLIERVCGYMKVDPTRLVLEFYEDAQKSCSARVPFFGGTHAGAAGTYREADGELVIGIEESNLSDPMGVVAVVAHELAHVCLLGDGRMTREAKDHEYYADLFTIFSGLGIFNANVAFVTTGKKNAHGHSWSVQRRGYMSEQMFGYALALFAWRRGEPNPNWHKFLESSPRHYFKASMKFLHRNGDQELPDYAGIPER